MKVKELMEQLKAYNPDADVRVMMDSGVFDFSIWFGSKNSITPKSECTDVYIVVDTGQQTEEHIG